MLVTMLKAKLHRATVTECDLHYEGSISIDRKLIEAAGLLVNERVEIYNIDNGERFATYVIEGKKGSGVIGSQVALFSLKPDGTHIAYAENQGGRDLWFVDGLFRKSR